MGTNKLNKPAALYITVIAFSAVINYIGANIAIILKLPVYLDTIGTFLTASLLGPMYAMIPGAISSFLTFSISSDMYALWYMPVQLITGYFAGIILKSSLLKKNKFPIGVFLVTLPGTIVSSLITVILFHGITSSGSTIIIQFLNQIGLSLTLSCIIVQFLTDYIDRFLGITIALMFKKVIPSNIKEKLITVKNKNLH